MKRIEQTFPVKLFENVKGPLQMLTALTDIVKRFNDEGKKSKQTESSYTPIFSKYESNILTIVSGGLPSIGMVIILIIMVKQIRLQSLVTILGLVSLIPPTKALYFMEILKAQMCFIFWQRMSQMKECYAPIHYLQWWVALLPYVVLYMLHIRYSGLCLGTVVTKTADVAQCISSSTMMTTMHH